MSGVARPWLVTRCSASVDWLSALVPSLSRDEIGPIHRHDDLASFAHDLAHPCGEQIPGVDAYIAEQPIDLFDPRLRQNTPRLRQRLANQRDRQRRRRHDPERAIGQRKNPLGVQIAGEYPAQEFMNEFRSIPWRSHPDLEAG